MLRLPQELSLDLSIINIIIIMPGPISISLKRSTSYLIGWPGFQNYQSQNDGCFLKGEEMLDRGGYRGKVLRIDLGKGGYQVERVEEGGNPQLKRDPKYVPEPE